MIYSSICLYYHPEHYRILNPSIKISNLFVLCAFRLRSKNLIIFVHVIFRQGLKTVVLGSEKWMKCQKFQKEYSDNGTTS